MTRIADLYVPDSWRPPLSFQTSWKDQLMVSKKSANKDAAIELVKFLTSPEIQRTGIKGQSVFRDFAGRAFERSSDTTLHGHRDI